MLPMIAKTVAFTDLSCSALFFLILHHFLAASVAAQSDLHRSVCQFPALTDAVACQRGAFGVDPEQQQMLLGGWFCDPESTMSMSEVFAIDETLRRLYANNQGSCVCKGAEAADKFASSEAEDPTPESAEAVGGTSPHCWHRFAFAFVGHLDPSGTGHITDAAQCTRNETDEHIATTQQQQFGEEVAAAGEFGPFANTYARVLRERWALGRCGEEILLLVVQRPTQQQLAAGPLSSAHSRLFGPLPMLFVSFGPLILAHVRDESALQRLVHEANEQLQRDAMPLFRVLNEFLVRANAILESMDLGSPALPSVFSTARRNSATNNAHVPRSHIPLWAWAVFGACGVAFGLMALGLFLIRTRTRRSGPPGKQQGSGMVRRHWKEEDAQQSTTYVNLVQLLMPHPKAPVNMPQQV